MTNENLLTEAKMLELILIMSGQHNAAKVIDRLTEALRRAETERDAARETIKTLNRRAQQAEAGVRDNVEACKAAGVSMGRTLANAAAAMYLRRAEQAEAERDAQAKEFARFKAVAALANSVVRWDALLNEMHEQKARAQRAEQERDAQAALVATLTAERDEARVQLRAANDFLRVVTLERDHAQQVEVPDAFWRLDEAQAQVWGLICAGTNMAERKRYYRDLWQALLANGLKLDAVVAELTATRDLLTAENARLRKEVATLELLRRGGK